MDFISNDKKITEHDMYNNITNKIIKTMRENETIIILKTIFYDDVISAIISFLK